MNDPTAKQFNMANLQDLDNGKIAAAVNHHIRQCIDDVAKRFGEKAKRKVNLSIQFTPIIDKETNSLDTVGVEFEIKAMIPGQKSTIYPMLPAKGNTVVFQPGSPLDPRQQVLFSTREHIDKETGEVIEEGK